MAALLTTPRRNFEEEAAKGEKAAAGEGSRGSRVERLFRILIGSPLPLETVGNVQAEDARIPSTRSTGIMHWDVHNALLRSRRVEDAWSLRGNIQKGRGADPAR